MLVSDYVEQHIVVIKKIIYLLQIYAYYTGEIIYLFDEFLLVCTM